MPLVRKARKPAKELGEAEQIREDHETRFARTFNSALGKLLTPDMLASIKAGLESGASTNAILGKLDFFDPKKPKTFTRWGAFAETIGEDYESVINDAIEAENRKRGWKAETLKADELDPLELIPVNAGAAEFVRRRSLTRAVDMSEKEKKRIRALLARRLGDGAHVRAQDMLDDIQDMVGLTEFQSARLGRKLVAARQAGMSTRMVASLRRFESAKIRLQRARAIARTETNDALSRGLTESWRQAEQNGWMPKGTKKRWVAMPEEPSSSEVCQELDGQEVGINEEFSSSEGNFAGPPAHPNCRSTMTLEFPE